MRHIQKQTDKAAFMLIELLVLIAIIIPLLSILVPSLLKKPPLLTANVGLVEPPKPNYYIKPMDKQPALCSKMLVKEFSCLIKKTDSKQVWF